MKSLSCVCCVAAALLMGVATPAHSNGSSCGFDVTGTTGLNFGALDPSATGPVIVTGSVSVGDCTGGRSMVVTIDGGQRNNNTMISAAGDLLPYSVSDPSFGTVNNRGPGNGNYKVVTFTGTVQATAYQSAVAGTYSDQLIVQVTP